MDSSIRIDNMILNGDRAAVPILAHSGRNQPPTQPISRIHSQKYQHRYVDNSNRQLTQQLSAPITSTPVQQRPTSNDMDIDLLAPLAPNPVLASDPTPSSGYRNGRLQYRSFGKRSRPTLSRDLDSAVKLFPPEILRTDVMNMEDGDGLENCKGDDSARVFLFLHSRLLKKLLLPGTLRLGPLSHVDTFFVDCGADDLFMDSKLAAELQIPLLELSTPITLRLADGDSSSSLTHRTVPLQLHIGKHVETATFYVTDLCHGFILGYSWLERHNPRINWVSRMVEFDSPYCLENCCDGSSRIQGLGKPPDTSKTFDLPLAPDTISTPVELSPISCSLSDSISLESMQSDVYPFVEVSPVSDASVPSDILSSFSSLFSEDQAETLPPHRDFDCSIDLKPGSEPFHGKIYQLTREEDKVMQDWIQDNLRKGFIRNSSSPHGAPCFFVKQKDKLRLCMDYRGLNKNTVKDRNPIPLISELLRTLSTGKIFTTLDLRGAYNLLRIKEGDESKTSF
ncbi:hypothetical protein BASA81_016529, partial [Batrachochytrium salamandrivorans]